MFYLFIGLFVLKVNKKQVHLSFFKVKCQDTKLQFLSIDYIDLLELELLNSRPLVYIYIYIYTVFNNILTVLFDTFTNNVSFLYLFLFLI
jgi:hypothetical protein